MVIEIKADVFNEIGNLKDVNYLISNFSNNRRYDYFCDIIQIGETELYKNLLGIDKILIEEYFNKFVSESLKMDFIIESVSSEKTFNIEEAKRYFFNHS